MERSRGLVLIPSIASIESCYRFGHPVFMLMLHSVIFVLNFMKLSYLADSHYITSLFRSNKRSLYYTYCTLTRIWLLHIFLYVDGFKRFYNSYWPFRARVSVCRNSSSLLWLINIVYSQIKISNTQAKWWN